MVDEAEKDAVLGQAGVTAECPLPSEVLCNHDDDPSVEVEGDEGGKCQWGPLGPSCCQSFRRPVWVLVCLCVCGILEGMTVGGFVSIVISTVERRFDLTSKESGAIASCYDVAGVLCLLPLSYFGGRGRRSRYVAVGMLVLGMGSLLFASPHFITDPYQLSRSQNSTCSGVNNNSSACDGAGSQEKLSNYRFVLYLGQALHGMGASPLYTLGVTYLDDSLPARSLPMYQGLFFASSILGPAIGFLAGGLFLNIYTDVDRVDTSQLTIDETNPRWIGAWWMGFLISGGLAIMIFIPMSGFPKAMPGTKKYRAEKEKEVYKGKDEKPVDTEQLPLGFKHIFASAKILVTNPTFMFLTLGSSCAGFVMMGLATFTPKFMEYQFKLTSGTAAQYFGIMAIPTGGGATFLGGWLTKRFNWTIRQLLKFCFACSIFTVFTSLFFLVYCDNTPFAGISAQYQRPGARGQYLGSVQLDATCNAGCGCTILDYNPVCGRDNIMYYSPCYAGCTTSFAGGDKRYSNCSCVTYNYTAQDVADSQLWMVQEGKCQTDCPYLPAFLVAIAVVIIGIFIFSMPVLTATLRCLAQDQKTFGLGVQWIIARILGLIPGPILYGAVIDMTCLAWKTSCKGEGSCFYYDLKQMSYNLLGVGMAVNGLSSVFFFLAFVLHRSEPSEESSSSTGPPPEQLTASPSEQQLGSDSSDTAVPSAVNDTVSTTL